MSAIALIDRPLGIGPLHSGEAVLDIGCGAGVDLLLAARKVGKSGRAVGVDMTQQMRQRAIDAAGAAGLSDISTKLREDADIGDGHTFPVNSHS